MSKSWTTKKKLLSSVAALLFLLLIVASHFDFTSDFAGLYILRCDQGLLVDVQSDLRLGEENRLLAKLEMPHLADLFHHQEHAKGSSYLTYSWNKKNGSGYIFNYLPDGKQLLTCFSRFRDSRGKVPQGLFVGGGLPYSRHDNYELTMSATGMAHFDGKEWHHLWCNVNETIASTPDKKFDPSTWKFLGSRVLFSSSSKLILNSSHEIPFDNTSLHLERYAIFHAGENYFTLIIKIVNSGIIPSSYYYVYGDEPWVGEFGTSIGNVGWTGDKYYFYESIVDPEKYSYAGMYDGGNPLILGEKKYYTKLANFIEWLGVKPNLVYFSNKEGAIAENEHIPLYSKDNRVIFLQWGPRRLMPRQAEYIVLAIGMAENDPASGNPVKPRVILDPADQYLIMKEAGNL